MSKLTQITLTRPHRHAGRQYLPGAMLTIRDDKAQWLIGKGVARPIATETASTGKKGEK